MGHGGKGSLAGGPSVLSTAEPSNRSVDSLSQRTISVLSHCSKGPRWGFGGAPRFKYLEEKYKTEKLMQTSSSPALMEAASAKVEMPAQTPSQKPESDEANLEGKTDAEVIAQVEESVGGVQQVLTTTSPNQVAVQSYSFGGCVPRLDGSNDRFLDPREHAGEPRPKSYAPAKTMGQGTAPCFMHSPMYSFGGGKSRVADSEHSASQSSFKPRSESSGGLSNLSDRRSKRKTMSRGFGSAMRLQVKGGPLELPISPGPAAYELTRGGDKVPDWASKSRLPWGVRTGSRTSLKNPVASDVGPGEYTAEHALQAAGPSPKIGLAFKGASDSRKDYPAAGHYDIASTMGDAVSYSVGPGQRAQLFKATCSPGPVYDPTLKGVIPNPHCASWGTSERRHPCDGVDPDEPPGPGAHNIRREYKASDKPSAGLPKDEKHFRTMGGMGPLGVPAPGEYILPSSMLGKPVALHLPLETRSENYPAVTDYDPKYVLTKPASGQPRPLHRTAPRKSIFEVSEGGSSGAAEALLKRALQQVGGDAAKPDSNDLPKSHTCTPSWSLSPKRPARDRGDKDHCATLCGSFSSLG